MKVAKNPHSYTEHLKEFHSKESDATFIRLLTTIQWMKAIMEDLLEHAVNFAEKKGIAFLEVRGEEITKNEISSQDDTIKQVNSFTDGGIGVRVIEKGVSGYSFTTHLTKEHVEKAVESAFKIARVSQIYTTIRLPPGEYPFHESDWSPSILHHPQNITFDEKKDLIMRAYESAVECNKRIATVNGYYGEAFGVKTFCNTEGAHIKSDPLIVTVRISVVSKDEGKITGATDEYGGTFGFEAFDAAPPEQLGRNVAVWSEEKLHAKAAPAGKFRALIENKLSGVLAHESFGHLSEYDYVITGGSPLKEKKGEKLGSSQATIIDTGVTSFQEYPGFSVPFDDEGILSREIVILKEGYLTHFLHTRGTAEAEKTAPTGNGRALDYRFAPICRMRNTYFAPGDLSLEEALDMVGDGLYVLGAAGGEVELDGTFLFKPDRAYRIEDGEITTPLRDIGIKGHIFDFLKHICGKTKEVKLASSYFGGCGKGVQEPLFVGFGGPHVVVSEAIFGGTE